MTATDARPARPGHGDPGSDVRPDPPRPTALLTDLVDTMKDRGLIEDEPTFTPAGRQVKDRVEARTDELALASYEALAPAELDELIAVLEPLAQALLAAQNQG